MFNISARETNTNPLIWQSYSWSPINHWWEVDYTGPLPHSKGQQFVLQGNISLSDKDFLFSECQTSANSTMPYPLMKSGTLHAVGLSLMHPWLLDIPQLYREHGEDIYCNDNLWLIIFISFNSQNKPLR